MANRPDFDDVRSAFERLDTPDKAAFVFEATFATIGQAVEETGRRVSEALASLDLDTMFRTEGTPRTEAPLEPAAPESAAPAAKPTRASARKTPNPGVPPTDDAPPAV